MTHAVEINKLSKVFPLPFQLRAEKRQALLAVDDLSLTVAEGEVYGLIGPNGSGKSTTMKALLGLIQPTEGSCSIFGVDSRKVESRSAVGYLPENPYFYKHLTGKETLRFYGKLCGLGSKELNEKSKELLDLVGLKKAAHRRLGGYSKGMLQRIGLAQALINSPRLVILDEPTAGVDPVGSREIRDLILHLKAQGISVFLCSHLLEQVQEICDRIGLINKGKLVREGSLQQLIGKQDQKEILLKDASPALLDKIRDLVQTDSQATLLTERIAESSLENFFLEETAQQSKASSNSTAHSIDSPDE